MSDTMEVLYAYAQEHLFPVYLCQDEIYEASDLCAQRQTELVRTALAQRDQIHLTDLLDELELTQFARDRAAFQAGFHLAAELTRI